MSRRGSYVFLSAFLLLNFFTQTIFGQPATAKQAAKGKLVEAKFDAASLKGNLLGDPIQQNISVYLPPSYDLSTSKRYPVVYLLHGFGGTNRAWTVNPFGFNVTSVLDDLIGGGKVREMIVVSPNGRNAYGGSFWVNSTVTGNWEDYIYKDVVSYVDTNYRTLALPASRGIGGHSMGGIGAVYIGMKHADIFSAVYALSPCCLGMEGDFNEPNLAWKKVAQLTSFEELPKQPKSLDEFYQHIFVAIPAAFSPNPERKPFYGDRLYWEQDGKLVRNEAVAAKWKAKMPLYLVEEYKQSLLGLRGIYLDYGQREEFPHIRIATTLFSKALAEHDIPHTFEIYEGGTHVSKIKERLETRVFEFFSRKLDFTEP